MGNDYTGKFRLHRRSDWAKLPAMRWLIKDVLVRHGTTLLYGPPKIGKKSFVGVSMACAVAAGKPWCGFETRRAKVLYVVGEGFYGVLRRQAAWEMLQHCLVGDNLRYLRVPINFFNSAEVQESLKALKDQDFKPDLIVIDTLARSMSGGSENDTGNMSTVFELIEMFRSRLDEAGILIIHHTTKDGLNYRGSSVIPAAVDGLIESKSDDLTITLTSAGFKDAAEFETFKVCCESVLVETADRWEGVLAVKDRIAATDILNRPADETGQHARELLEIVIKHFAYDGATSTQLRKQSGMKESTFYRALDRATEAKWLIGGGGRGSRYCLNPDGTWKTAVGGDASDVNLLPSLHPFKGVEVEGSNRVTSTGVSWKQVGSESNTEKPKDENSLEPTQLGTEPITKASALLK
jgi:hypothetical protein